MRVCATVLMGPGSEANLPDAIRSLNDAVDGFVLINGGGGVAGIKAVRSVTDKSVCDGYFDWTGSYSDARNFALRKAEENGYDFAVTLDADERVTLAPDYRLKLEAFSKCDVWVMRGCDHGECHDRSPGHGYCKERILRCNAGLKWHGRVCENVPTDGKQGIIDGHFWELQKDPASERRRFERGVVECQRMIAEGDDRYKWWRHMGSCQAGLGNHSNALHCYEEALKRDHGPEDQAWCSYLLAEQLVLAERFDEAHAICATELAKHAGFIPEFGSILAYIQYKGGDVANASRWAQLVMMAPADRTRVGHRSKHCKQRAGSILNLVQGRADRLVEEARDAIGGAASKAIEVNGVRIPITARFSERMVEALLSDCYEVEEAKALEAVLRPDDRVLDLGAGCGYLSTLAAKKLAPGAVMAVEPDPDLVDACKRTFAENEVSAELIAAAVWGDDDDVCFERTKDFWSNRVVGPRTESCIDVPGVTPRHLIELHRPTVIMCDIEGCESVLPAVTLPPNVRALIIECHTPSLEADITAWMTDQRFTRTASGDRTHTFERVA